MDWGEGLRSEEGACENHDPKLCSKTHRASQGRISRLVASTLNEDIEMKCPACKGTGELQIKTVAAEEEYQCWIVGSDQKYIVMATNPFDAKSDVLMQIHQGGLDISISEIGCRKVTS